jgi:hypothetical protein
MNHLKLTGIILATTLLFGIRAIGQSAPPVNEPDLNRPRLFDNLPSEIPVSIADLKSLFASGLQNGKDVTVRLSQDSRLAEFKGKVVSYADKYSHKMKSVVIRSSNFNGAALTLTAASNPDGSILFSGRILSFQHGDMFELQKKNNQYMLVKKNFYELVNE